MSIILRDATTSTNELKVNSDGSINVDSTGSGTGAVNLTEVLGTAISASNPVPTQDSADGAPAATPPTKANYKGVRAAITYPTAVTDGQLVGVMADKAGRQVNVLNAPRNLIATISLNSSSSSLVSLIAAGATGVFNDIISFIVTNESATATIVSLSDGTVTYKFAIAANGGIVVNFTTPLPATSSATAWQVLNSAAVACDFVVVYAENK